MTAVTTIAVVRLPAPNRLKLLLLVSGMLLLVLPSSLCAQEDSGDIPLGDLARSLRRKPDPSEVVVDNDNLSKVVDDAETRRAAGSAPVFSLDPGGKTFKLSSPDVSCSLSFSARTSSLLSDPLLLDDLPRAELAKLDGPATIDGDSLQVSLHNGTSWELHEVVIGLTIVKRPELADTASRFGQARIVPAVAVASPQQEQDSPQKQPDVTLLLRAKGSAAPSTTAIFRMPLNFALFPDQDWHWAIVRAKGIAPQTPGTTTTTQPEAAVLPPVVPEGATKLSPPILPPSNKIPSSPDTAAH